jgi:hypothetical protein
MGNTCFLNSVVQCLIGSPAIVDCILNSDDKLGLAQVVKEIISIDEESAVEPIGLLTTIYVEDSKWKTKHGAKHGVQQCAADFLTFLIESIPELQKCVEFNLQIKGKLEPQTVLNVSLEVYDRMHLNSLLCFQYPVIRNVSPTLIVVVKRWVQNAKRQIVKDARPVEVPEILEIYDENGGVSASLKLCGVVLHKGTASDSGHYKAYTMAGEQCLLCNDTVIEQVQTDEMLREAKVGFVLMFQKQEPEAAGGRRSARLPGPEKKHPVTRREENQPVTRREEKQPVIEIIDDEESVSDLVPLLVPQPVPPPVLKTQERAAEVDKNRTFAGAFVDGVTRAAVGYVAGCALAVLREAPAKKPKPEQDNSNEECPLAPSFD